MKKDLRFFWKLFRATFTLSAFTFGGGYVIVPLMRKKFVEQLHWIEEEEMLDITAIAQSSPGAMAVNASILVGYRLAGLPGTLTTVLGTVMPPFITLTLISLFYFSFSNSIIVRRILDGMQAGVVAVIADVTIKMAWTIIKRKEILAIAIMIVSFVAVRAFQINVVYVLLISGLIGALNLLLFRRRREEGQTR